jgi:hypothetical protein
LREDAILALGMAKVEDNEKERKEQQSKVNGFFI